MVSKILYLAMTRKMQFTEETEKVEGRIFLNPGTPRKVCHNHLVCRNWLLFPQSLIWRIPYFLPNFQWP